MLGMLTGALSFFRLRWRTVLIVTAATLLVLVVWQWRSDIKQSVQAVMSYEQVLQDLEDQKQALRDVMAEQERRERLDKQYQDALDEIQVSLQGLEYEIHQIEQADPDVADWADNPQPDVVYERLRAKISQSRYQNGTSARPPAGKVGGTDPAPDPPGE